MKDIVIIGSGPAGLTAAIYAKRANLDVCVIEDEAFGGKLSKTYLIENYPGFESIEGGTLAETFYNQALNLGSEIITDKVIKINDGDIKEVICDSGNIIQTKTIIIASGSKEKHLAVKDSENYTGRGISYCAVCDGFFYRKKDVVVVGGGNSALEEALFLANIAASVTIIIRRNVFRADKRVVEKVLNNEKIKVIYDSLPEELVIENDMITGLKIKNVLTEEINIIPCKGIFPYVGASPNTSFVFEDLLDENGYLLVDEHLSTKRKGIYGAGDVIKKELRQVVTATNDGAIAANSIIKLLK